MPLSTLLIHYMNWTDRLIPPRPRRVLAWSGFFKTAGVRQHAAVLALLQHRIEAGEDLRPFLSERVARCGYVPRVSMEMASGAALSGLVMVGGVPEGRRIPASAILSTKEGGIQFVN